MASSIQNGTTEELQQTSTTTPDISKLQQLLGKIKPSSFNLKRNYSMIDISADKWLMAYDAESLQKLENPPSLADGLSRELEKDLRYFGCELIQSGAILLDLPQTAAATGQILFQRYYYQKSFARYKFEDSVMACLLLASKIEEEPRKPRDVLNVYHRLKQIHIRRSSTNHGNTRYTHLDLGNKDYMNLKNAVIRAERKILNTLGFVVHVHHPHKLIYIFMHVLRLLKNGEILQRAWNYMNDGLRTDMFLRYTPETIACACIFMATRTTNPPIVLPKQPFPWFELFDASDRDIKSACSLLIDLYNRKKPINYQRLKHELNILEDRLQLRKPDPIELAVKEKMEIKNTLEASRKANIESKLQQIVKKHSEKAPEKTNGKHRDGSTTRTENRRERSRSRDRDDRNRYRRGRSKERDSNSSTNPSRNRDLKRYDDARDREREYDRYDSKKRRERN